MIVIEINDDGGVQNVFADNQGEEVLYITWHGSDGVGQPKVYTRKVQPISRVSEAFLPPSDRD